MNPNIALGIRPVEIPDPLAGYQKALTMQALLGQNNLQNLQTQEAQRTLRLNSAMDEAAQGATSMEDYFARLQKINPGAAVKLQKDLIDQQETQGKVNEQQSKMASQLAGSVANAAPQDQAIAYQNMVAEWRRLRLPSAAPLPDQWDPAFLPHMQAIASRGLTAEQSMTRGEYNRLTQPEPTTMGNYVAPVASQAQQPPLQFTDETSGAVVRPADVTQPQGTPIQDAPTVQGNNVRMPDREVTANRTGVTPDDLRAQAAAARKQGTKAGMEVAKDLENSANQLESRILEQQKLDENVRQRQEQIELRRSNQGNQKNQNTLKLSDDFRQEPAVKEYRTVQPLIASMQNALGKDTAASDLDMVYAIAKIFDPGSVVREGEQIMIVNAGGLPSKIQSLIGSVNGGQRLSSTLRAELMDQASSRADNYKQAYDSAAKSYREQAKRWDLNPDDIVRDYRVTPKMEKGKGPRGAGSGTQTDPFKIKGDEGFDSVPSGQYFIGPDGKLRQKP